VKSEEADSKLAYNFVLRRALIFLTQIPESKIPSSWLRNMGGSHWYVCLSKGAGLDWLEDADRNNTILQGGGHRAPHQ
jgi:hypothetical protein